MRKSSLFFLKGCTRRARARHGLTAATRRAQQTAWAFGI